MDEDRFQQRVGRNEAAFRAVNEGIERGRQPTDSETVIGFVCECGHRDCHRLVDLTPGEYDAVRQNPRRFLILEGHEIPAAERVVERHERYLVVEKRAEAATLAERTDPRR